MVEHLGQLVVPGRLVRHLTEQQLMEMEVIFHHEYLAWYRVSDHMHLVFVLSAAYRQSITQNGFRRQDSRKTIIIIIIGMHFLMHILMPTLSIIAV